MKRKTVGIEESSYNALFTFVKDTKLFSVRRIVSVAVAEWLERNEAEYRRLRNCPVKREAAK